MIANLLMSVRGTRNSGTKRDGNFQNTNSSRSLALPQANQSSLAALNSNVPPGGYEEGSLIHNIPTNQPYFRGRNSMTNNPEWLALGGGGGSSTPTGNSTTDSDNLLVYVAETGGDDTNTVTEQSDPYDLTTLGFPSNVTDVTGNTFTTFTTNGKNYSNATAPVASLERAFQIIQDFGWNNKCYVVVNGNVRSHIDYTGVRTVGLNLDGGQRGLHRESIAVIGYLTPASVPTANLVEAFTNNRDLNENPTLTNIRDVDFVLDDNLGTYTLNMGPGSDTLTTMGSFIIDGIDMQGTFDPYPPTTRILVLGRTDARENGVYLLTNPSTLTRSADPNDNYVQNQLFYSRTRALQVASVTEAMGTITITTTTPHSFSSGDTVDVAVRPGGIFGSPTESTPIITATSSTEFTFSGTLLGTPTGGTASVIPFSDRPRSFIVTSPLNTINIDPLIFVERGNTDTLMEFQADADVSSLNPGTVVRLPAGTLGIIPTLSPVFFLADLVNGINTNFTACLDFRVIAGYARQTGGISAEFLTRSSIVTFLSPVTITSDGLINFIDINMSMADSNPLSITERSSTLIFDRMEVFLSDVEMINNVVDPSKKFDVIFNTSSSYPTFDEFSGTNTQAQGLNIAGLYVNSNSRLSGVIGLSSLAIFSYSLFRGGIDFNFIGYNTVDAFRSSYFNGTSRLNTNACNFSIERCRFDFPSFETSPFGGFESTTLLRATENTRFFVDRATIRYDPDVFFTLPVGEVNEEIIGIRDSTFYIDGPVYIFNVLNVRDGNRMSILDLDNAIGNSSSDSAIYSQNLGVNVIGGLARGSLINNSFIFQDVCVDGGVNNAGAFFFSFQNCSSNEDASSLICDVGFASGATMNNGYGQFVSMTDHKGTLNMTLKGPENGMGGNAYQNNALIVVGSKCSINLNAGGFNANGGGGVVTLDHSSVHGGLTQGNDYSNNVNINDGVGSGLALYENSHFSNTSTTDLTVAGGTDLRVGSGGTVAYTNINDYLAMGPENCSYQT